jgi:regulator of protease activity HflC (stomatin/prohibitin superfamily)
LEFNDLFRSDGEVKMALVNKMDDVDGHAIGITAFAVPFLVLGLIGWFALSPGFGIFFSLAWTAFYLVINLEIVNQQEYRVVERLGQFWDVKLPGFRLYCFLGYIDKIRASGDFQDRGHSLFLNTPSGAIEELDFMDGASSPVDVQAWFHVAETHGTNKEIKDDVRKYTYRVGDDPKKRAVTIIESVLRPKLQAKTSDEISSSECREEIAKAVADAGEINDALKDMGLYLQTVKPILIEDVALPPEVIRLREQRLIAEIGAGVNKTEAGGVRDAIHEIMHDKNGNEVFTRAEATRIWEGQKSRDTFEKINPTVTIIGESAGGVTKTFAVNRS